MDYIKIKYLAIDDNVKGNREIVEAQIQAIKNTLKENELNIATEAYQVIDNGNVVGYVNSDGESIKLPKVCEATVIDDEPEFLEWMQ